MISWVVIAVLGAVGAGTVTYWLTALARRWPKAIQALKSEAQAVVAVWAGMAGWVSRCLYKVAGEKPGGGLEEEEEEEEEESEGSPLSPRSLVVPRPVDVG